MNILLINHYAGSPKYGMEYRPYYIAKEWVKMGHNVTIIGASFSHLRLQQPIVDKNIVTESTDGINYLWIKSPKYNSTYGRIVNIFTFVFKLFYYAKQIANVVKPDLVIASSTYPLDIYPAKKISKLKNAKLCYEVHDLWPLSPMIIGGYSKWHPFIFTMQIAENYSYKHVDKVISLLWNSEEHMKAHGLVEGKFKCIPNGYSKKDWEHVDMTSNLPTEHQDLFDKLRGKFIIGFAGGFAASGALDTLINAAIFLRENKNLKIVLVGKGPERNKLESLVRANNLDNVYFLPAVNKTQIPQLVSYFDIAYLGGVHSILHFYGTSANKLTDYMLASKPVVFSIDEPNALVERVGCGIRVEAENPKQVAEAILKLSRMSGSERALMGAKGKDYAIKNLEWGILAKRFIEQF